MSPSPAPVGASSRALFRGAATASIWVLFSRVSGLLREVLFATMFGASREYDAFLMAFRIPNLLRDLFAEGALSQAFTKVFAQVHVQDGERAAWDVANRVLTLLVAVVGALTALGMLFASTVVGLIAPGFADVPGKADLTTRLTTVMFPFILLVSCAALVMGMLNARGNTGLPQRASAFFNWGSIAGGLAAATWWAPDYVFAGLRVIVDSRASTTPDTAQAADAMLGMAVGVLLGGALQLLVQLPAAWRLGWRPSWTLDSQHPRVREVLFLMGPAVIGAGATQVNVLINSNFASHLGDNPVSWLNYAFRFMQFPIGVFGVAIAAAALPEFSRATADRLKPDMEGLRRAIRESVALACLLCIPAAVGLGVLGEPLIGLIYQHGRFTAADTDATAAALMAYSVGLTGYAAVKVLQPALLSLNDARTPMWVAILSMAVNLGANWLTVRVLGLGHVGLAMTTSFSALLNAAILAVVLRRRAGGMEGGKLLGSLARTILAATVMGGAVWGTSYGMSQLVDGRGFAGYALRLFAGGAVGVAVFGALAWVMRIPELSLLVGALRRRRAAPPPAAAVQR